MVPLRLLYLLAICAVKTIALPCTWSRYVRRRYEHAPEHKLAANEGRAVLEAVSDQPL